jgi:acyl carrier protein
MEKVDTIAAFICREILKDPSRTLTVDEPIISSGLIDSFSLVDMALFIEEQFGVRIEDTELNVDTFDSLSELAGLIEQKLVSLL